MRAGYLENWNLHKTNPLQFFVFDQECNERLNKDYAGDPFYLPSESVLPSSIQGFVLCRREDKSPVVGFYAFPYVHKLRWRRERILRVTRPLLFSRSEALKEDAFSRFIQEIMELGRRTASHQIEIELYAEIRSRIFFPSTNCAVNTYNALEWVDLFEKAGFVCSQKSLCYEMDLQRVREEKDGDILIRPCRTNEDRDRKLYYDLWVRSGECPYDLAHSGFWYVNAFGWPRLWYSETAYILNRDDFILFAEKDCEALGIIHWWPNLFQLFRDGGRKAIILPEALANEALSKIEEGKIFKIVVSHRAGKYRDRIERSLISEAMRIMKEKYLFRTCQVGNVSPEKDFLVDYLRNLGGEKVHEVRYMRKRST